jgi:hypothetical protein
LTEKKKVPKKNWKKMDKNNEVVTLRPIVYDETEATDFSKMVAKDENDNAIFLLTSSFLDRFNKKQGSGTAALRPFLGSTKVRAICIPTGWSKAGPFEFLDEDVKKVVVCAFQRLAHAVIEDQVTCVYYSADPSDNDNFAYGSYKPDEEVRAFIAKHIKKVLSLARTGELYPMERIKFTEDKIEDRALRMMICNTSQTPKKKRSVPLASCDVMIDK